MIQVPQGGGSSKSAKPVCRSDNNNFTNSVWVANFLIYVIERRLSFYTCVKGCLCRDNAINLRRSLPRLLDEPPFAMLGGLTVNVATMFGLLR